METRFNLSDLSGLNSDESDGLCYVDSDIIMIENFRKIPDNVKSFKLDMLVAIICKRGSLRVNINGQSFLVERDNILICSNWHFLTDAMFSADFSCTFFAFSMNRVEQLLSTFGTNMDDFIYLSQHPVIKMNEEEVKVVKAYHTFFKSKLAGPHYNNFASSIQGILFAAVSDIFAVIDRIKREEAEHQKADKAYPYTNSVVQNFLMLLANDVTKARSVKYYADKLCVTPKYLSSLCRNETGKVPSHWIRDFLVEKIKFMLTSTNMSCKEVAVQLEFPNSSFFGKFVKQCLGCSPLEYRKQNTSKK